MATDAGQLDLLRKSLDSLKSRFQSVTNPRDKSKAWLIQFNDGHPDGFSALVDKWIAHAGKPKPFFCAIPVSRRETRLMPILKSGGMEEEPGHRVPGFKRKIQVEDWDVLGLLAEDAIRLMMTMPDPVQRRIWSHLPLKTEFGGMAQTWVAAVFELAWQAITHSPLRADKWVPLTDFQKIELDSIRDFSTGPFALNATQRESIGENPSWYSNLDDFAAASVQAIDILQSWLADVPKPDKQLRTDTPSTASSSPAPLPTGDSSLPDWLNDGLTHDKLLEQCRRLQKAWLLPENGGAWRAGDKIRELKAGLTTLHIDSPVTPTLRDGLAEQLKGSAADNRKLFDDFHASVDLIVAAIRNAQSAAPKGVGTPVDVRQSVDEDKLPVIVFGYADILTTIGLLPVNDTNKGRVKRLSEKHDGPIIIGKNSPPKAERSKLIGWWKGMEAMWQSQEDTRTNAVATVEEQYLHGKDATVFPGIGGHEKKSQSKKG